MTTKTIRIGLDARYDLYAASLPNDEDSVADFEAAYRGCAAHVAEKAGVEIEVRRVRGGYDPAILQDDGVDDETTDMGLWQGIHDCLEHDGDEWQWDEDKADRLADRVRRNLADA